jgi:predicted NUDIX family NTP pyrophosphohydrolase
VFALAGDLDAAAIVSNTFTLEWPRGSERLREFPEIDRAAWFDLPDARTAIVRGQVPFLDRLADGPLADRHAAAPVKPTRHRGTATP